MRRMVIVIGLAAMCGCTHAEAASAETTLAFFAAVPAPGSELSKTDPGSLFPDEHLAACDPCRIIEWENDAGRRTRYHVAMEPAATLSRDEVKSTYVVEALALGSRRTFYQVEVQPKEERSEMAVLFSALGGRYVLVEMDGRVIDIGAAVISWREGRVVIASRETRREAVQLATNFELEPIIVPLSEDDRKVEEARFLEFAADLFWESACDLHSDAAREQADAWSAAVIAYPELPKRIDCSIRPSR